MYRKVFSRNLLITDLFLCLWTISLASYFSLTESISISSTVSFICSNCLLKPEKCCIGTFIVPAFVLTTRYCAHACRAISVRHHEIPIAETYVHNRRSHIRGKTHDSVAIVRVSTNTVHKYNKLSSLGAFTLIGFRAWMPYPKNNTFYLKYVVITSCDDSSYFNGIYICANTNVNEKCNITRGTPLLVEGRVIGIMGDQNVKTCKEPKAAFMAIDPVISWIKSVIQFDKYIKHPTKQANTKTQTGHLNESSRLYSEGHTLLTSRVTPSYVNITSNTILSTITNDLESTAGTKELSAISQSISQAVADAPTSVSTLYTSSGYTASAASNANVTSVNPTLILLRTKEEKFRTKMILTRDSSKKNIVPTKIKPLKKKNFRIITTKALGINSSKSKLKYSTLVKITPKINKITAKQKTTKARTLSNKTKDSRFTINFNNITNTKPRTEMQTMSKMTNALDWFNEKVRKRLQNEPLPVLVLTTTRSITTTEFIDLT